MAFEETTLYFIVAVPLAGMPAGKALKISYVLPPTVVGEMSLVTVPIVTVTSLT